MIEAETIFFHGVDNTEYLLNNLYGHDPQRLADNLKWMCDGYHASQIARMFLYSRLAQHFGQADPDSWKFAERVADDAFSPQALERLKNDPETYYLGCITEGQSVTASFKRMAKKLSSKENPIRHMDALKESAEDMIKDFRHLCDGSWAMKQLRIVEQEIKSQKAAKEAENARPKSHYWKKVSPLIG